MTHKDQTRWLNEHVPHRVRACLAELELQQEVINCLPTPVKAAVRNLCLQSAAFEGRMAGIRWLIEFVGIVEFGGKPDRPKRRGKDVSIKDMAGGEEIDLNSADAVVLSKVWKGCAQASGHPTQDSNHPPVDPKALDEASRIIVSHLERTIYSAANRRLLDTALLDPLKPSSSP